VKICQSSIASDLSRLARKRSASEKEAPDL
jgi:hypothetical protein